MQKRILFSYLFFIAACLSFFVGCDQPLPGFEDSLIDTREPKDRPLDGSLHVYNKTGHDIYISGSYKSKYVLNGERIDFSDDGNHDSGLQYSVEAFKEELDAGGNVIWGFYYKKYIETFVTEDILNINLEDNKYNTNDRETYPITESKQITITNKTGYIIKMAYNYFLGNYSRAPLLNNESILLSAKPFQDDTTLYMEAYSLDNKYYKSFSAGLTRRFIKKQTSLDLTLEMIENGSSTF